MYVLKHIPEDFVVEELASHEVKKAGKYLLLKVTKKGMNTEDVASQLAKQFGVPRKNVGYAGAKDKHAVTTQYFSVKGRTKQDLKNHSPPQALTEKIDVEFVGYLDEAISLGMLEGNKFTVIVRGLKGDESLSLPRLVPNYFDEQRFSSNNVRIGEALIRKEFAVASDFVLKDSWHKEKLESILAERPNDHIGALTAVPIQLLRLYLHAFQSRLWNEVVARFLEDEADGIRRVPYSQGSLVFPHKNFYMENKSVPLPGFGNDDVDSSIQKYVDDVLAMNDLEPRDFVIKQLPNLSLEGDNRDAFMKVEGYEAEFEDDEEFPGKKKCTLNFTLGKGSYATMLVRTLFT